MQRRLGTSSLTYGGYSTMPPLSDPSLDAGTQNLRNWIFQDPDNSLPLVRSSIASESVNGFIRRGVGNSPEPFAIYQSNYPQIGLERNFMNYGYNHLPEYNQNLHSLSASLQQGSNYQQQQHSIGYQPSFLDGLSGLRNGAGDTHAMINQRIYLQPNPLSSINASQESSQKTSDISSCTQLFYTDPSWTTVPMQPQINKPNPIQDSQGPTKPGTKECPIMVPEDSSTDHLDSVYEKIQKCKDECLHDVLKIHRHFVSKMPQYVSQNLAESAAKMVLQIEDMIKLLSLQRSSMEHRVHKKIAAIYVFTRCIRNKHPMLFAESAEESKSDNGEQQTVPSATRDKKHTHQKHDILQQEAVPRVSEAENNVVSHLQPTQTSTNSQPIDGSLAVNQNKNIDQDSVSQTSPMERLIKAVNEASPEDLMGATRDIFAAISAADRIHEIPAPAYENGRIYKRIRNFDENFAAISATDGRISSQSSIVNAKRQKVEAEFTMNKKLMDEIEFLNKKVFETQVVIVKPDAGWQIPESSSNITVSCSFTAASLKAYGPLSHLFPARMQLSIPRDYPESWPTIVFCRHQNCGQMCASLQTKYESWSRSCDMTSVTEIVKAWNACARELFVDICLGPGRGRERLGKGNPFNWTHVSV